MVDQMHVFKNVIARVVHGNVTLQFYLSDKTLPFKVKDGMGAKGVADPQYLHERVCDVKTLVNNGPTGDVSLTRSNGHLDGPSWIRGYQGGLAHFLSVGDKRYLVSPLRGTDAPSSKLHLDIHAGRIRSLSEKNWGTLLAEWGHEVAVVRGSQILYPQLSSERYGQEIKQHNVSALAFLTSSYAHLEGQIIPTGLEVVSHRASLFRNNKYVRFEVYDQGGTKVHSFDALFAALPWVSSIEAIRVVQMEQPVDSIDQLTFYDLNTKPGDDPGTLVPVDRAIYVTDLYTAETAVWQGGEKIRVESLGTLLQENYQKQLGLQQRDAFANSALGPVSPKLLALASMFPELMRTAITADYSK
jgi:hypothetical protein